jgi:hypothetical protein
VTIIEAVHEEVYDAVNRPVYAEVCDAVLGAVYSSLEFDVEVCSKTKEEQNGKG